MTGNRGQSRGLVVAAYLACGGIAVGSFGPWGAGFFGYGGISSNGSLTLLAAGLAAFAIWRWTTSLRRSVAIATLALGALCVAIAVRNMLDIRQTFSSSNDLAWIDGVGWGLGLVLLSGIALVLLSIFLCRRGRASRPSLNWKQRALVIGVGAVFVVGLWSVASSDPSRSGSESLFLQGPSDRSGARGTAEKILPLRPGMSAELAMETLGRPESVHILEDESTFYYGPWQLTFIEKGLRDRIKYSMSVPESSLSFRAYDRRLRMLDRRIRKLRPGVSIEAVRERLGRPEGVEVYGTSLRRDVGLWYGEWRLDFDGEKFEGAYR